MTDKYNKWDKAINIFIVTKSGLPPSDSAWWQPGGQIHLLQKWTLTETWGKPSVCKAYTASTAACLNVQWRFGLLCAIAVAQSRLNSRKKLICCSLKCWVFTKLFKFSAVLERRCRFSDSGLSVQWRFWLPTQNPAGLSGDTAMWHSCPSTKHGDALFLLNWDAEH